MPVLKLCRYWEKRLFVKRLDKDSSLLVLVNRGMTIGTPDVVTAITMAKNDEIDKFVALLMKKKSSRIVTVSRFGSRHLARRYMWTALKIMILSLESGQRNREDLSSSDPGCNSSQTRQGQADHLN